MNRPDFPFFQKNQNLIYFDSACQSVRPKSVIDATAGYYETYSSCTGRSQHRLAGRLQEEILKARNAIAGFIGAGPEEIIFTKNTTEGINLVAHSFKDSVVLTSDKEHSSNFLPWRLLEQEGGRHIIVATENGDLDIKKIEEKLERGGVKLVSFGHASNIDGIIVDAKKIIAAAHKAGAYALLDAAQSVPHVPINVREMDVDFLAFSGHKILGPSGVGALYVKKELQKQLSPLLVGGGTVSGITEKGTPLFFDDIRKFEAGLQNYAGILGFGAAIGYMQRIGWHEVMRQEKDLFQRLSEGLQKIPGIILLNFSSASGKTRAPIVSFRIDGIDSNEVARMLDIEYGILVRSGVFCNNYYFALRSLPSMARISLAFYNEEKEIDEFLTALSAIVKKLSP